MLPVSSRRRAGTAATARGPISSTPTAASRAVRGSGPITALVSTAWLGERLGLLGWIGLICLGSSGFAVAESSDQLWKEYGIAADSLRLRGYPFTEELKDFIERYERIYVVEQNRDAQLLGLMRLEFDASLIAKLRSVRYYGGLPLDARTVTDEVARQELG